MASKRLIEKIKAALPTQLKDKLKSMGRKIESATKLVLDKTVYIAQEFETRFTTLMIKLGAHIVHLTVYSCRRISAKSKEIFAVLGDRARKWSTPLIRRIKDGALATIIPFLRITRSFGNVFHNIKGTAEVSPQLAIREVGITIKRTTKSFGNVLETLFNYAAPVVAIAFLVGVVKYAGGLNYAVSVEYNGENLGYIADEQDYDVATHEVQERISYVEGNGVVEFTPKFSLRIIDDENEIVNSSQLADRMISNSDADLKDAYGVYIDEEFYGAVESRDAIMNTMADMLKEYSEQANIDEVSFTKSIEYKEGLYLSDSIVKEDSIIDIVTSKVQVDEYYTVEKGDTPIDIAEKFNIPVSELVELNPNIEQECFVGDTITLNRAESFMPIQYQQTLEYSKPISFETVEVESSSIYKGNSEVLIKGVAGEEKHIDQIAFIDGYEVGRTSVSSEVVKDPVTQKVAIGTKVAAPAPAPTVSQSTTVKPGASFVWPVAGGYVSCGFNGYYGHKGTDIAAPSGTAIFAAKGGTVVKAATGYNGGYGNLIIIDHGNGYQTYYAHCSSIGVSVGQQVSAGQYLGGVGRTGQSSGNHLHFEIRYNGVPQDAKPYLGY